MLTVHSICCGCSNQYSTGIPADESNGYVFEDESEELCADCLMIIYAENMNLAELLEAENGYREV